jgi:hypothetical protein
MRGVRHALRNFTAQAVMEHLRSQVEDAEGPAELTENELRLVRFIRDDSFDWDAVASHERPPSAV